MVTQRSLLACISAFTLFNVTWAEMQATLNKDAGVIRHPVNRCENQCFQQWVGMQTQLPKCLDHSLEIDGSGDGVYGNNSIARCLCEATPQERDLFEEYLFQNCVGQREFNRIYSKEACETHYGGDRQAASSLVDHTASTAKATPSDIPSVLPISSIDTLAEDEHTVQTSSAARKSAPRFIAVILFAVFLLLNLNGVTASDDESSSDDMYQKYDNGITYNDSDNAPECLESCSTIEDVGSGNLPQCVRDQLPEYASDFNNSTWLENADDTIYMKIYNAVSCICTDVAFIKELAGCVFGGSCGSNNTAIYDAFNLGYKYCGITYNITFPAPSEVVKLLDITVPSGAVVPTTITGVPLATAWPGKDLPTDTASTSASTTSSANSNSTSGSSTPNSAMKNGPSKFLAILATLVVLGLFTTQVEAQSCDSECNEKIEFPSCAVRSSSNLYQNVTNPIIRNSIACLCTDKDYLHAQFTCGVKACISDSDSFNEGILAFYTACQNYGGVSLPAPEEFFKEIDVDIPKNITLSSTISGITATATAIPSQTATNVPSSLRETATAVSTGNNVTATGAATPSVSSTAFNGAARNGATFGVIALAVIVAAIL